MRHAIVCTVAALGAAMMGVVTPGSGAFAASQLQNCKPHRNCRAAGKPCDRVLGAGQAAILIGSTAANAPKIGKSAIRVRLCTGPSDTCGGGYTSQGVQVYAVNARQYVYQVNLNTNHTLGTGGYTEIGTHTYFAVHCMNISGSCRFAWQHCRKQLPLRAPSSGARRRLKPGLKTK